MGNKKYMGFIIINSIFRSGFQFLLDELLVFSNIYIIYIQIINGYGCTINKEINNSEINLQRLPKALMSPRSPVFCNTGLTLQYKVYFRPKLWNRPLLMWWILHIHIIYFTLLLVLSNIVQGSIKNVHRYVQSILITKQNRWYGCTIYNTLKWFHNFGRKCDRWGLSWFTLFKKSLLSQYRSMAKGSTSFYQWSLLNHLVFVSII